MTGHDATTCAKRTAWESSGENDAWASVKSRSGNRNESSSDLIAAKGEENRAGLLRNGVKKRAARYAEDRQMKTDIPYPHWQAAISVVINDMESQRQHVNVEHSGRHTLRIKHLATTFT